MKILLAAVNAKFIHSSPAVYSLRAYAKKRLPDAQIDAAEYTINEPWEGILADLVKRDPDVLAVSCYIWNLETVRLLLPTVHETLPKTAIWLGGPEVSYHAPRMFDEFPYLTGVIVGEGEETFTRIAEAYQTVPSPDFHRLPGVCLAGMTESEVRLPAPLSPDDLPFFYREWSEDPELGPFAHRLLYYETSRGCPFRCSYCLSSVEKTLRFRSLDKVWEELRFFLDRRVRQVKFIDRTFNADPERARAVWKFLLDHDNGLTNFHFEIAGDRITGDDLAILTQMRPGLVQLEIGVQSTNEATLEAIRRKNDLPALRAAVDALRKAHNIHLHLDLIAGLPYEDYRRFRTSFNDLYALHPDELQLGFLKVLKGTPMEEQAAAFGITYGNAPPYEVESTRWISRAELDELKAIEEMLERYSGSGQFKNTLAVVILLFADPFAFFEALAAFYRIRALPLLHPARAFRYEALFDFLTERFPEKEALFSELLTLDYILRERPKKRLRFFPKTDRKPLKSIPLNSSQYAELFSYPVFSPEAEDKAKLLKTPQAVILDYAEIHPLTHDAAVHTVDSPDAKLPGISGNIRKDKNE